ncbi:MAG: serine/threonine protein kinase [Deltaproteobacteria bacterium]|nr:serine/threonine protein kinase [Deltaproteobacteria bacterium]MCB9785837.1 serine/threonine protein kinase [Deltaproteobacteria bacterium]
MDVGSESFEALDGQIVDGFVLVRELARGRTSVVYQALDSAEDNRMVAFKVLQSPERRLSVSPDVDDNAFEREAKVARLVDDPGILRMYRTGRLPDGRCWVVAELAEGMTLEEELRHRGTIPWPEALEVATRLAAAVGGLHRRRIVHRDLTPARAMVRLGREGKLRVKIIDFGLARFVYEPDGRGSGRDSSTVGTPRYMAPEQARGAGTSAQTDVYSVGLLLYEMLTGRSPLGSPEPTPAEALAYLRSRKPLPSIAVGSLVRELPRSIAEVVDRTLSRDPRLRAPHGEGLARELEAARAAAAEDPVMQASALERLKRSVGGLVAKVKPRRD